MERVLADELTGWTDEALLAAYRELARADLDAGGKSLFIAVIGERNARSSRKAQQEWLDGNLAYALRSRRAS